MRLRDWAFLLGGVSAGLLVYGALYEANRLVVDRLTLRLPRWPKRLAGTKIAVLADLHLRDEYSLHLAKRAVAAALDESPDFVCLLGDLVSYWRPESARMLGETLEPLLLMGGSAVAIPGNHEYHGGDPSLLAPILDELNIKLLRNEAWTHEGICWVGIDSENAGQADPYGPMARADHEPIVVLWHEPDVVDRLPAGAALMLSGHGHGGQFRFPGGIVPMKTVNAKRYLDGFYPEASTPLFVSRGVGTTGPPSRFLCPPHVAVLTLEPGR